MTDPQFPQWFQMLRDEYAAHAAKVNPHAQARLLRRFAGIDPQAMLEAVEAYMDDNQYFPIVSTLKPYVDAAVNRVNEVRHVPPEELMAQRLGVMQRLYAGDPKAVYQAQQLAVLFRRNGRPTGAEHILRKVAEFRQSITSPKEALNEQES